MLTVQVRSVQVHIPKLLDGVKSMVEDLRRKLYGFSDGTPIKLHIPQDLADDLTSTSRGDSWMSSAHTLPREQALMRHMTSAGSWQLSTIASDGLRWNRLACEEFMDEAAKVVGLIATLVHIGAGPPCRGTEQMADRITNGIQPRTLYLSFGRLLTIRRHTKNTHASGLDAFNVCYYPQALTELITYYLLVIRPLERAVAEAIYGAAAAATYDMFLYVHHGSRMSSTAFSQVLEQVTAQHIGLRLSLNPIRHVMIAFQRAYVEEMRIPRGDNIGDLLSAHSSKTADAYYAREHGLVEGMTATYLLDVQEWCDMYHDAIGLGARMGPLIPLRTQRKLARDLGGILHSAPGHALHDPIQSLVREIQTSTFKSAVTELQPFIRGAIDSSFAEAWKHFWTETSSTRNLQQHRMKTPGHLARPSPPPSRSAVEDPPFLAGVRPTKRTISEVYPGSDTDRTTSENKRRNAPEVGHPLRVTAGAQEPYDETAQGDLLPSLPVPRELLCTESTILSELREEVPTRPSSPDVNEPSSFLSYLSLSDAPTPHPPRPHAGALVGLRTILQDDQATFKSTAQEDLVNATMSGNHAVAILPTGAGKSMAFEIPPVVRGALTIAIVPFKTIAAQILRDANLRGIRAELWRSTTVRETSQNKLIVMAVETATTEAFLEYVTCNHCSRCNADRRLTRWLGANCSTIGSVVFDEAHTIITAHNFRKCMSLVSKLMEKTVPVIFITATLPPRLLSHFREVTGLPHDVHVIRDTTNRPEIIYMVKPLRKRNRDEQTKIVAMFAAKLAEGLEGEDRGIVFVRRKDDCEPVAKLLHHCPSISSDVDNEAARMGAINQWEDGNTGGMLVGTSSLIQGLHYPHVRCVVFFGAPWGLIDLVQGAGRGGRDGRPAYVVVIDCHDANPKDIPANDPQCIGEVAEWLPPTQCRRVVISATMDIGDSVTCQTLDNAQLCDYCQPQRPVVDEAWVHANSASNAEPAMNTNLHPSARAVRPEESCAQIPLPSIHQQFHRLEVIDHSLITRSNRDHLFQNTRSLFNAILAAAPTCSICWYLSLQETKPVRPKQAHLSLTSCAAYRKTSIEGFQTFYDYSTPNRAKAKVSHCCT